MTRRARSRYTFNHGRRNGGLTVSYYYQEVTYHGEWPNCKITVKPKNRKLTKGK